MDKKEYVNRVNEIKASDALKKRIIEAVNEEENRRKNDNRITKIMAGMGAIAGVAVVALVIGINMSNRDGAAGRGDTTKESQTAVESPTEETTTPEQNNKETHTIITDQEMSDKMLLEAGEPDYVDENNFFLKIKISNTSESELKLNPKFWVERAEDDFAKGLSYTEISPQENIDFQNEDIIVAAGQTETIDITEEFLQGYRNLLASDRELVINFDAYADLGNGMKQATLSTLVQVSNKLDMIIGKTYIPFDRKGENAVVLTFKNLTPSQYSFTADTVIRKFNAETLAKDNIEGASSTEKITLMKDGSRDIDIAIPDNLAPGMYYVESSIKNEDGETIMNKQNQFVILADGVKGELTTDRDVYNSGDSITARITGDGGVDWKQAEYTLYRVLEDGTYGDIIASGEMDVNENVMECTLDITEPLAAGTYSLIAMADDGNEVSVGVGTVKTNQFAFGRTIEVR